jgi:putative transposase
VPRDWWLEAWEKQAILDYHDRHALDGYRRLAFMMLDDDVVAVSPSSVYRVLKRAGRLDRRNFAPSKKGTGFVQPLRAHAHWHVDVSYINLAGTFYFLCTLLDGYSRYIVHWELRESMKEFEVETVIQRAREKFPGESPRIISDNGPQFIARDFDEARRRIDGFVEEYNHARLHSALGYVTPADKLQGLEQAIFADRDAKLEAARERRRLTRRAAREVA